MDIDNEISFIRLPQVLHKTTIPKSTLMEMINEGEFPAPVALSARSRAWVKSEVECWMQERIDKRNKKLAILQVKNESNI